MNGKNDFLLTNSPKVASNTLNFDVFRRPVWPCSENWIPSHGWNALPGDLEDDFSRIHCCLPETSRLSPGYFQLGSTPNH